MAWKRWIVGSWSWKRPFLSLGFLYLSLLVVACGFSDRFIFQPPPPSYQAEAPNLVLLDDEKGKVAAFYYPPPEGGPVLLWSHGNAEDIGGPRLLHRDLAAHGLGLLAYDYPGYGLSEGRPSEKGCYRAAELAWEFLATHKGIPPGNILVVGQSVGSGPACYLAEKHHPAGLALISPLLSIYRVVMPVPLFPGDKFRNIERIPNIDCPLLVIHGPKDEVIGYRHGRKLYELHDGPKRFVEIPEAGHNDLWSLGAEEMLDALARLARETRP